MIAFETNDQQVFDELSNIKIHEQSGKQFTPTEAEAAALAGYKVEIMDYQFSTFTLHLTLSVEGGGERREDQLSQCIVDLCLIP